MNDFNETDQQHLISITALNLATYLQNTGWEYEGQRGQYAHIFTLTTNERKNTVAVPTFELLDDHPERVLGVVKTICTVENRIRAAVIQDLVAVDNDRVHIESTNGTAHGRLTMSKSGDLLEAAYNLMSNSARAAEAANSGRPKAAFRGDLSNQVSSYLDQLTFSPDFHHGYRLTMYSPVPVELGEPQRSLPGPQDTPFSRATTQTLAQALEATTQALSISARDRSQEYFRNTVNMGVSANLCDSLSRLAKGGKGVSIHVNWSLLHTSHTPPLAIAITHQQADILGSAAEFLRTSEPSRDELIHCHVIRLERQPADFDGSATLLVLRDGKTVRASAEFSKQDYAPVIQAFVNQQPLSLIGDIQQNSTGLALSNPHDLKPLLL